MTDAIAAAFARKKAFIPFITAGDPSMEATERLVPVLERAGADLIELGIPFSDPVAEGPVIARASLRALEAGATADKIFDMTGRLMGKVSVPILLMTYVNPIFTYGPERFMRRCRDGGVAGVIVPDLPFEEKGELSGVCREYGVRLVSLVAPTSRGRIETIAREAQGFLYCVSSMGVTGERSAFSGDLERMMEQARANAQVPCAIGFGVSTAQQARQMAALADGVIVGSAVVKLIERYGEDCAPEVEAAVREMKDAIMETARERAWLDFAGEKIV